MAADFDDAFASDDDVKPVKKIDPPKKEAPKEEAPKKKAKKGKNKKGKAKAAEPEKVPEPTIAPEEAA